MKTFGYIILTLFLAVIFNGAGCTKIDTPLREDQKGTEDSDLDEEELLIITDKFEILDTEPLCLSIEGARGTVLWKTDPFFDNCFQPESGSVVLFLPPDVTGEQLINIIAEDEQKRSSRITIIVIDEGKPPQEGDILLNEICWAGTLTSAYDEYIEIISTANRPFYLNNWKIENGAGLGTPLTFSARIEPGSVILITNYSPQSDRTSITVQAHYSNSSLSLSNAQCGPFKLLNGHGTVFDIVGDGGSYTYGVNQEDLRSSMSRFTNSFSTVWTPVDWYTESISKNLKDGSRGTPGAENSDLPLFPSITEDDAQAVITEYAIDPVDDISEDWAELYITKTGTLKNFTVTDLDGEDLPITGGVDLKVEDGDYYLIIWHDYGDDHDFKTDGYRIEENTIFIPDLPPSGTKDQIVLLIGDSFVDGLCYYSGNNTHFDNDEKTMRDYGWMDVPIHGKHAAKLIGDNGEYINEMAAVSWNTMAESTPGTANK